jgi:hypothetical protein
VICAQGLVRNSLFRINAHGSRQEQTGGLKMTKRLLVLAAGAMALLAVASTFDPADARSRGGGRSFHGGHARAFSGHAFHGGRTFRRGVFVGVPLAAYGGYYYANSCSWLRHRALVTGSGYWWSRYYACRDGYY